MRFVPDGGQRELEMGIAGENGVAGFGSRGGYCPVVAAKLNAILGGRADGRIGGRTLRRRDVETMRQCDERGRIRHPRRWKRCKSEPRGATRWLYRLLDW